MPLKAKRTIKQFPRVAEILPGEDTFYEQKGPIVWLTKKHLQKIEMNLQLFEDLKKKMDQITEANNRFENLKKRITKIADEISKINK